MKTGWQIEMEREISKRCHSDGVGCDGSQEDRYDAECRCMCHSFNAPEFVTNDDVIKWHLPEFMYLKISKEALPDVDRRKFSVVIGHDGTPYISPMFA